jgi:hypothetical protein
LIEWILPFGGCMLCVREGRSNISMQPVYFKDSGTFQIIKECGFCFIHGIITGQEQKDHEIVEKIKRLDLPNKISEIKHFETVPQMRLALQQLKLVVREILEPTEGEKK